MSQDKMIAGLLIATMGADNGCHFNATDKQLDALEQGVRRMLITGCTFETEVLWDLAAGDVDEVREKYCVYDGFYMVRDALTAIFEGDADEEPDHATLKAWANVMFGVALVVGGLLGFWWVLQQP